MTNWHKYYGVYLAFRDAVWPYAHEAVEEEIATYEIIAMGFLM